MFTVIIIIFSIIVLAQLWYIIRLRKVLDFVSKVLSMYASALVATDPNEEVKKVNEYIEHYK